MTEAKGNLRGMTQEEALELQRKMLRDTVPAQCADSQISALEAMKDTEQADIEFLLAALDQRFLDSLSAREIVRDFRKQIIQVAAASRTPAEGEAERIAELQYEAGMYKSLYDAASARVAEISLERDHALGQVESVRRKAQEKSDFWHAQAAKDEAGGGTRAEHYAVVGSQFQNIVSLTSTVRGSDAQT